MGKGSATIYDRIVERGIQFLLIFTLASFGTVQNWSVAVMEIISFLILGVWLLKMIQQGRIEIIASPVIYLWLALIGIILLQVIPMPLGILKTISPRTVQVLTIAGVAEKGTWHPISLYPYATKEELYKVLAYASIFTVIVHQIKTKEQIRRIVNTIVILGCILVVFAVLQKMTWNGRLYWLYPVSPGIESNMNYIWGPYINRNHFAGYLEMSGPLAMGMFLYHRSKHSTHGSASSLRSMGRTLSSHNMPKTALFGLAVIVLSSGIFMSVSRGGILGFTISSLLLVTLARLRRTLRKHTSVVLIIGLVMVMVSITAAWERIEGRFERLADSGKIMRYQIWKNASNIICDYPIMGTGAGTFSTIFPRYQSRYSRVRFEHAENDFIEVASDLGIAGFMLCLSIAVVFFNYVMRQWWRRKELFAQCVGVGALSSCFAIVVHSATDFNLRVSANAMLLTVIAGLSMATVMHAGREHRAKSPYA